MILADFEINQFHIIIFILFISFIKHVIEKFKERFSNIGRSKSDQNQEDSSVNASSTSDTHYRSSDRSYTNKNNKTLRDNSTNKKTGRKKDNKKTVDDNFNDLLQSMGIDLQFDQEYDQSDNSNNINKDSRKNKKKLKKLNKENKKKGKFNLSEISKNSQDAEDLLESSKLVKGEKIDSNYKLRKSESIGHSRYNTLRKNLRSARSLKTAFLFKEILDKPISIR